MKKLTLKALELGARELLSREQLKNIMGGTGSYPNCENDEFQACAGKMPPDNCCFMYSGAIRYGTCHFESRGMECLTSS